MLTIPSNTLYTLFLVSLFVTEFYWITVGDGVARIYHFLAVVVVLLLAGSLRKLFRSGVFLALLAFAGINIFAVVLSDNPEQALASLMSFFANVAVAMAVALLLRNKVPPERFMKLILTVTVISVFWGLVQIVAFKMNVVLALSVQQLGQIGWGFGPGFRTEANTFGKALLLPFLLFLPFYLRTPRSRWLQVAYLMMMIGILMNFTRTAIYGLMVALLFAFLWCAVRGQLALVMSRTIKIVIVTAIGIALITNGIVQVSDYAKYKLDNFFKQEEILEGGSSAHRLGAMEAVIDNTVNDSKRLFIGNGWGQTYYMDMEGVPVQSGGGDLVNVFGYAGMLGLLFYLLYSWLVFRALMRVAQRSQDKMHSMFAEGLLFAFVGMFCTGLMSGYLITPEYWLLIGSSIYISTLRKPARNFLRFA